MDTTARPRSDEDDMAFFCIDAEYDYWTDGNGNYEHRPPEPDREADAKRIAESDKHWHAAMRGEVPFVQVHSKGTTTSYWFKQPSINVIRRTLNRRPERRSTRQATRHAGGTRRRVSTASSSSGDDGPLPHRAATRAAARSATRQVAS